MRLRALLPLLLLTALAAHGQSSSEKTGAFLEERRQSLAEELASTEAGLAKARLEGQPPARLQETVDLLRQIDFAYERQLSTVERREEIARRREELTERQQKLRTVGPEGERPFSFAYLDSLRDRLVDLRSQLEEAVSLRESAEASLLRAREEAEERERQLRLAREAANLEEREENERATTANRLATAELQARLAREQLIWRQAEMMAEREEEALQRAEIALVDETIALVTPEAQLRREDVEDRLAELEEIRYELSQQLEAARAALERAEEEWLEARQRLDTAHAEARAPLREEVELHRLLRSQRQTEVALLTRRLERLELRKETWLRRLGVATRSADPETVEEWKDEVEEILGQLDRDERLARKRLDDLRRELDRLVERTEASSQREGLRWLRQQPEPIRALIATYEEELRSLDATRLLDLKLEEEIGIAVQNVDLKERLASWGRGLSMLWHFEVAQVDERPVTVRKIVLALLLVFVGLLFSRGLSRLVSRRILPRLGIAQAGAAAIQSVLFYLLLVLFTVGALNYVDVPLTWFTVLGGAVAIGVGFGSQNIINNFISGLILLAERPVKVGDMIQLGTLFGNVEHIGARATRVVTGENLEIIVPNSTFLQSNVTNWTHGNDLIRTHVAVGVAYGSPVEVVKALLVRAAVGHPRVASQPSPFVWFSDFGNDALLFQVHFWIRVRSQTEWLTITSDIRFAIDRLFRAAGVVIAFPQRDLHFDLDRPLEVRMRTEPPAGEAPPPEGPRFLRRLDLFEPLEDAEIEALARDLVRSEIAAGETIIRQGDPGSSLLVIERGVIGIEIQMAERRRVIREMVPGQCFGEISLLTGDPRGATARALSDAVLYELSHDALRPILDSRPEVADTLSQLMAERLTSPEASFGPEHVVQPRERNRLSSELLQRIQAFFGLGPPREEGP